MNAKPIDWLPEKNNPGWWRGSCPGEGCGKRLAKYWTNGAYNNPEFLQEEITLERGVVQGPDGVYRKSGKHKDNYPVRSRDLYKLRRTGYGFAAGTTPQDRGGRGPRVEVGAIVRCPNPKCLGLAEITRPKLLQSA